MSVDQTSIAAYHSILETLPKKRKQVYNTLLALGKASLERIASYMNKRPSDISGRITELKKCFLIKEVFTAESQRTGNTVTVYTCTTDEERVDLVNDRYIELIRERDLITNDLNLFKGISQASRRTLLDRLKKTSNEIKALRKVL